MQLQYTTAFRIFFKHDYFSDGNLRSLVVKPTDETQYILRKLGAIFKTFQNGFQVLFDLNIAGKKRTREEFLENRCYLKFMVKNLDTAFLNYTTDFNANVSGSYFFFTNRRSKTSNQNKTTLHSGSYVSKEDIRMVKPTDTTLFDKPFSIIHIKLHPTLEENLSISFTCAASTWCYVLSQNYLLDLVRPAIIDKETKAVFNGPTIIQLPGNKPALTFYSPMVIPQKERRNTSFQLVEEYDPETLKYKIVIPALPCPDRNHISSLKNISGQNGKNISYIFI